MLLKGQSLSFAYGSMPTLQGVDIDIHGGEMVGLIGPNGAGKTTLLRLLAGLLPAQQGSVLWKDQPLAAFSDRDRARQLAYLPQGASAHWPLTVERVVELGRIPHRPWWQSLASEDRLIIDAAMEQTNVTELRSRIVTELSGGERTRVMLARALASEPQLLLADEPVASLDPHHQLRVMRTLRAAATQQRAVLVVLHDLELAARFCDRLIALHGGELIAHGQTLEVLRHPVVAAAYQVDIDIKEDADGPWVRFRAGH